MKEIFLTTIDNVKIAVNCYLSGKESLLIISPGWFMTKDSAIFKKMSLEFSKKYDVLSMDFRGHGRSSGFYTFTQKEGDDLSAVVNYAKDNLYNKIFLLGFSLGGAQVILHAAKIKNVDKVIAVSAPTDFDKIENHMYSPDAWIPTLFQKFEPKRWLSIRPGSPFGKKERPIDFVGDIEIPTLLIAGEKDPTVFPWHTEELYKKARCKKDYKLLKKARHAEDLYTDFPVEFMELCTSWLDED